MKWTVVVARAAQKALGRLPARDQNKIRIALRAMEDDPFGGDTLKLEGLNNRWRLRVGSYRIFFGVDHRVKIVAVSAIARRTSTTY